MKARPEGPTKQEDSSNFLEEEAYVEAVAWAQELEVLCPTPDIHLPALKPFTKSCSYLELRFLVLSLHEVKVFIPKILMSLAFC